MKKFKKTPFNGNREKILSAIDNLENDEEVYIRTFTPSEALRMMGVEKRYIDRLSNPHSELKKAGYNESQIKDLLSIDGKMIKVRDRDLRKQAGNSIVVDVLYHVFDNLFFNSGTGTYATT